MPIPEKEKKKIMPENAAILVTGFVADEAAILLLESKKKEAHRRFPKAYLEKCESIALRPDTKDIEKVLKENGDIFFPISDGGLLASLYAMSQEYHCGLKVDLKKVPIRQETIEICEFFGRNPYTGKSRGVLLVASKDPNKTAESLLECGVGITVIGYADNSRQKILKIDDREQYLTRPEQSPGSISVSGENETAGNRETVSGENETAGNTEGDAT